MRRTAPQGLLLGVALAPLCAALAGCTSTPPASNAMVPEIAPGVMAGYLDQKQLPDSLALLPPPPQPGTPAFANDEAVHAAAKTLRGTPRWQLAALDAELMKPSALQTFSCALGVPVNDTDTPNLARLLKRTLVDAGLSTSAAKTHYQRTRPFVAHGEDTCLPKDEPGLRKDGSYPSGHTAIGWTHALVLTQVSPGTANALLARGRAFAESRVVCNAHWQSDIIEGKVVAAGTYALLQANPGFREDVRLAADDVARARAAGLKPTHDCSAEAAGLAMPIPGVL